ncbi:hypothetical protein A3D00_04320 [Candidatus Woesebacteria bacterium RIFCSPHIGHO2_02_FULL_38_9]|uniref:Carrier domain-containing protein n=1 Tax=Candidatus Woesebacteria bacterium RIFCSPHIGHO2_01_FULL_39_28 TaxID=1802496 RepID=A0A1F7YF98_9BACT|nr:MAG: hypothetical protein A2627_00195 [Candidatus Woesebacteria bacterium RIFCSPHIGHO2_01_FULL_39_28]OGM32393.1 MAG: hypothetical protein A3D00_04320 [Candidatus Woesebacteria bacterium RIFCSPHIGHO2_02_FULL_38_9]OGM57890.1 MAG: hypothetical protein A3A50_04625 [Candidatus Woesebacteria bacterium RIFCSPLOWO2_01_FULL_38_20]
MSQQKTKTPKDIIKMIATQLGIETDDISMEDSLKNDLHMTLKDLSELANLLLEKGFPEDKIDFSEIETVEDLINKLILEEEI